MALILCPECARYISEHAASCPNCGHQLQRPAKTSKIGKEKPSLITGILTVVLIILLFIAACVLLTRLFLLSLLFVIGGIALIINFHAIVYFTNCVTCPHCMQEGNLPKRVSDYHCRKCGKKSFRYKDVLVAYK